MAGNSSATMSTSAIEMRATAITVRLKRTRKRSISTACLAAFVRQEKTLSLFGHTVHTTTIAPQTRRDRSAAFTPLQPLIGLALRIHLKLRPALLWQCQDAFSFCVHFF